VSASKGDPEQVRLRSFLPALALLLTSALALGGANLQPAANAGQVAAIFSPAAGPAEILRAVAGVDGRLVRTGLFDNIVVVALGPARAATELYAQGAWLVIDPIGLGSCLVRTTGPKS